MPAYKKKAIPCAVRREVAARAGAAPFGRYPCACHYCDEPGTIYWPTRSWVTFSLELDHVLPEFHGGAGTAENIVLACRTCNRSRGHRAGAPKVNV
jgi:5-methylcytosine-specific restriction endonuclease McrA